MIITAKFASTCPVCQKHIAVGSQIEWEKGRPARHTECQAAGAAPLAVLHSIISCVRYGGDVGGSPEVYAVTGIANATVENNFNGTPYALIRGRDVRRVDNLSGSGRSGTIEFKIYTPGAYRYDGIGPNSGRHDHNGFIWIDIDGSAEEINFNELLERMGLAVAAN